ncbi:MAG: hypothetical protein K2K38_01915 [Clostridia bacterium]|nr:hypothetical protein [Clostridia bacterium]
MKSIEIHCQGILYGGMVWWEKVEDAARYYVHLSIAMEAHEGDGEPGHREVITVGKHNEIACVEKDRLTCYHTFDGLAVLRKYNLSEYQKLAHCFSYYVWVQAEDKNGNIIAESNKYVLEPIEVMKTKSNPITGAVNWSR